DLNEIVIRACADVAAARRYDPGRYGAAEPVWIADGEHPVADLRDGIRERDVWEVAAAVDFEQSDIGFGIGSDHLGLVGLLIVRLDFDRLAVAYDVAVGYHIAVGRNEEA